MNTIEMQYKRDTGNSSKIGFECNVYRQYILNVEISITYHFDIKDEVIELHTPEYVKWLEEKAESGSEVLVSQLRKEIEDLKYELYEQNSENSELEDKIYQQECEIDELKDEIETLEKVKP